tara:strand:+ start:2105 stop:3115 length:1011 start_codon:yes stop_codon:yes gene_type:complete
MFPREIWAGSHLTRKKQLKREIIKNSEDFKTFIQRFNNKMNCYTSVYDYKRFGENQAIVSSVILDRLFLDFDSHGKPLDLSLEDMKLVLEYLDDKDYMHEITFSGNGFHVFVFGEVAETIRDIQHFFYKIFKLTKNGTLDKSGVQTRRLRRIPNTVNMNTKECLYCIPLDKGDLTSVSNIIALAKKPTFLPPKRYGNRPVKWPNAPSIQTAPVEIATQKPVGKLPIVPCMYNSIMVENPTHQSRYYLVSWFRTLLANNQKCYDYAKNREILEIIMSELKEIASHDNIWLDWDEDVTKYHAEYTITNDGGYMFPSCDKLISEGFCVGKCWRFPNVDN